MLQKSFDVKSSDYDDLSFKFEALIDELEQTKIELGQHRSLCESTQQELDKSQLELDKSQSELVDMHEKLGWTESQLEIKVAELVDCNAQIAALNEEVTRQQTEIEGQAQKINEFNAKQYPQKCASLTTQIDALKRHTQQIEGRVEMMEKERRALRMALRNEIEYLRTA